MKWGVGVVGGVRKRGRRCIGSNSDLMELVNPVYNFDNLFLTDFFALNFI